MLGLPPFNTGAFTSHDDDGGVTIYFMAPGVSVDSLTPEVLAAAG